jgi:hypothetical protein
LRLKRSLTPQIQPDHFYTALDATNNIIVALKNIRFSLALCGINLVQGLFPGRHDPVEFNPNVIPDCIEGYFRVEHEYLISHSNSGDLAGDLKHMGVLEDLMGRVIIEQQKVRDQDRLLVSLHTEIQYYGLFLPRCITKPPRNTEGIKVMEMGKPRRGLEDCHELKELVRSIEQALGDVGGPLDFLISACIISDIGADGVNMSCQRRSYRNGRD